MLKYIPNALTLARLVLVAPFLWALANKAYPAAFYIFSLAGLTDALDGWLARAFRWQSSFGSFIDPLADKFLIASSFISLAFIGALPWWLVALVFMRDLSISLGVVAWFWFVQHKLEFNPTYLSKINTVLQLLLMTCCLFQLAFHQLSVTFIQALITITAIFTTLSYIDYLWTWGKKAYTNTSD